MASESEAFHPSSFRIRDAHIYKSYQTLERAYTSHSAYLNSTVSLTTALHPWRSYKRIIENRLFTTFRLPSIFLLVNVTHELIFYDMCISPTRTDFPEKKILLFCQPQKLYNMQIAKIFSKYRSILFYFILSHLKLLNCSNRCLWHTFLLCFPYNVLLYYCNIYIVSIFKKIYLETD